MSFSAHPRRGILLTRYNTRVRNFVSIDPSARRGAAARQWLARCKMLLLAPVLIGSACRQHVTPRQIDVVFSHNDRALLNEHVGIAEAAAHNRLGVGWNGPANWDVKTQIDLMEAAVRDHSYGIAVDPASRFAINTAIRDALSTRIPVVVLLDPVYIAPSPHLYFVLEDTKASAALVSARLNHIVKGAGEIAILGGDPLLPGSIERHQDLVTELRSSCPELVVDDHQGGPSGSGYLEISTEQILRRHPHLSAIVALNMQAGLAAYAAIHNDRVRKDVHLIVYDQSDELFILLRRGEIDALIVQSMRTIGRQAVSDIVADRRGTHPPAAIYVKPLLVTRENIDDEAIQQNLQMNLPSP